MLFVCGSLFERSVLTSLACYHEEGHDSSTRVQSIIIAITGFPLPAVLFDRKLM